MQHVIPRIGYKKPLIVAPWLIAAGLFWLSHMSVNGSHWTNIFPGLVLTAAGMGVSFIAIIWRATAGCLRMNLVWLGLLNTSQQIGGSLGLAILSGIATSGAAHYAKTHAAAMNAAAQRLPLATHPPQPLLNKPVMNLWRSQRWLASATRCCGPLVCVAGFFVGRAVN